MSAVVIIHTDEAKQVVKDAFRKMGAIYNKDYMFMDAKFAHRVGSPKDLATDRYIMPTWDVEDCMRLFDVSDDISLERHTVNIEDLGAQFFCELDLKGLAAVTPEQASVANIANSVARLVSIQFAEGRRDRATALGAARAIQAIDDALEIVDDEELREVLLDNKERMKLILSYIGMP